jgi:hypothetical protein
MKFRSVAVLYKVRRKPCRIFFSSQDHFKRSIYIYGWRIANRKVPGREFLREFSHIFRRIELLRWQGLSTLCRLFLARGSVDNTKQKVCCIHVLYILIVFLLILDQKLLLSIRWNIFFEYNSPNRKICFQCMQFIEGKLWFLYYFCS